MHQHVRPPKRLGASRQRSRRAILLVLALLLTTALVVLLFASGPPADAGAGLRELVAASMWNGPAAARAVAGKNAAFCATRLQPRLPGRNEALPASSIYDLASLAASASETASDKVMTHMLRRVRAVFDISVDAGRLRVPPSFQSKALQLFPALTGNSSEARLAKLEAQPVVTVENVHTHDMTYFNDIRRYRPGAEAVLDPEDEVEIARRYTAGANEEECDFCSVVRTAEDVFGRMEGPHAYTAANIAKLSAWHSLVVARTHNPVGYNAEVIEDMVAQAAAWFDEVRKRDAAYGFGNVVCDIGKRASASQVHLHFQVWMTKRQFASGFAKMHTAARAYEVAHNASYWAALVEAHAAAGLVLQVGSAYVFPHLSPAKEKEIVVLEPTRTAAFGRAVAQVMLALRDGGKARSMSLAMALPYPPPGVASDMPAVFRIVDRGNPLDARGDTGGLEYFASPYVGTDPYRVRTWLQQVLSG